MNTTYDDIIECFIENCGIDTSKLPTSNENLYNIIKNAVRHYNTRIDEGDIVGELVADDTNEILNAQLDDTRLLLLAYCLKYIYLENQLVGFEELWAPFQQEIGFKNYKDQITGRERTLQRTEQKIYEYLSKIEDKEIM